MINIPEEVKQLLKNDNTKKNFRVHFPNGERADITNENIIEESVSFTESICSYDKLKFGLCESPFLEFETVGIPNIKGCTIECSIELYCAETTEGAEYKEDIGSWVYGISLGVFVVNSCKKKADMSHRLIQAYSNINISTFDVSKRFYKRTSYAHVLDVTTYLLLGLGLGILSEYTKVPYLAWALNSRSLDVISSYKGKKILFYNPNEKTFSHVGFTEWVDYVETYKPFTNENICIKISNDSTTSQATARQTVPYEFVFETYLKKKMLNSDEVLSFIVRNFEKDGNLYFINTPTYAQDTAKFDDVSLNVPSMLGLSINDGMWYGRLTSASALTASKIYSEVVLVFINAEYSTDQTVRMLTNDGNLYGTKYESLKDAYEYAKTNPNLSIAREQLEEMLGMEKVFFDESIPHEKDSYLEVERIVYTPSPIMLNYAEIQDNQEVIEGWLELQGKFGKIERSGSLILFDAKNNFIEHNGTLSAEDYSSLWYDDDESLPIGRLICTWKDAEGTEHFSERIIVDDYDEQFFRTYSITENWFIQNFPYTSAQITSIFNEMSNRITSDIRYMPMELEMKGRPDIEVGDVFDIETDEGIITGFIEKRTMLGIDNLLDSISAEDEERAISNSSIKSSFDEETGTLTIYT